MRLSELSGKEVINLGDGARLGIVDECELTFESKSGRIHSLLLPDRAKFFGFFSNSNVSTIPWQAIRRIGDEVIIVDLNSSFERMYGDFRRERQEDAY